MATKRATYYFGVSLLLGLAVGFVAQDSWAAPSSIEAEAIRRKGYRGWEHLVNRLIAEKAPAATVRAIYSDPRMPRFEPVYFKLTPREPKSSYRQFTAPKRIAAARRFLKLHESTFFRAERTYGVGREVIAAILLVETHFGAYTGKERVLVRLSRLAGISDPHNIAINYRALRLSDPTVTLDAVKKRAAYLESTFLPEIPALISIAERRNISPYSVLGSSAGAFGYPQFLPTSYLRFGTDGDGDNEVSLFNPHDAILSVGKYLAEHGWSPSASYEDKLGVIWHYNRSDAYCETILQVAQILGSKR